MADTNSDAGQSASLDGAGAPRSSTDEAQVRDTSAPKVVSRVNAALLPGPANALAMLIERTGMKKVDVVNRALQIYDFLDEQLGQGKQLIVQQPNGKSHTVSFH